MTDAAHLHQQPDALQRDNAADDSDLLGPAFVAVQDQQGHRRALFSPDDPHRVQQAYALGVFPLDFKDYVAGANAGHIRRRVGYGSDDGDPPVAHAHLGPDTLEEPQDVLGIDGVLLGGEIGGIRIIQRPQHASYGPVAELVGVQVAPVDVLPLQQLPYLRHALEPLRQPFHGRRRLGDSLRFGP